MFSSSCTSKCLEPDSSCIWTLQQLKYLPRQVPGDTSFSSLSPFGRLGPNFGSFWLLLYCSTPRLPTYTGMGTTYYLVISAYIWMYVVGIPHDPIKSYVVCIIVTRESAHQLIPRYLVELKMLPSAPRGQIKIRIHEGKETRRKRRNRGARGVQRMRERAGFRIWAKFP